MAHTKIDAFLTARGAKPQCELCGQNNWSLPEDDQPMVVKLQTETPPRVMGGGLLGGLSPAATLYPQMGTVNAYVVACLNCGNIRFHAESVVKGAAGL